MRILSLISLLGGCSLIDAWSPTNGYAPGEVPCPDTDIVRRADGLHVNETAYIKQRQEKTSAALLEFYSRLNMTDFDYKSFLSNSTLGIGLAFSGGGHRAMLTGAGQLAALDNRTTNAVDNALGGLLQASNYIVGLSGGSWLVGTVVLNNWTSVEEILEPNSGIWDLAPGLFTPGGNDTGTTFSFYMDINQDYIDKEQAGFNSSLGDAWGRALSKQLLDMTFQQSAAYDWSDIRNTAPYLDHEIPFPIVLAMGRTNPSNSFLGYNDTIFEFNPLEMGSWDSNLRAFADLKYVGTRLNNGTNNGTCIAGYDNAAFVMGTSSSLFSYVAPILQSNPSISTLSSIVPFLKKLNQTNFDSSIYAPNPFKNFGTNFWDESDLLTLVDGGYDGEAIPFEPLLQHERKIDTIIAFDSSSDTDNGWPDGASVVASYERQFGPNGNNTGFPYVPSAADFITQNLTNKPTFFGCNGSNLTSLDHTRTPPLIIYIANQEMSYLSNTSTFQFNYTEVEKLNMIKNGYETASRMNLTLDSNWPFCVGCALIKREQERRGINPSKECSKCFSEYCWGWDTESKTITGSTASGSGSISSASSTPTSKSNSSSTHKSSAGDNLKPAFSLIVVICATSLLMLAL